MIFRSIYRRSAMCALWHYFPYRVKWHWFPRIAVCATMLLKISAAPAEVFDQFYTPTDGQCQNLQYRFSGPMGQEFVPSISPLDFVELWLQDSATNVSVGANVQATIRADTMDGAILATSTAHLADNLNVGGSTQILTRFNFDSTVWLTPGNTYLVEAHQIAPIIEMPFAESNTFCYWCGSRTNGGTYASGRGLVLGTPLTNFDFGFRTGTYVPEPASVAMLGIGVACLGFWCQRVLKTRGHSASGQK